LINLHAKLAQSDARYSRQVKRSDRLMLTIATLEEQKQSLQLQVQNGGGTAVSSSKSSAIGLFLLF